MFWWKVRRVLRRPIVRELVLALIAVFGGALLEKKKREEEDFE